MELRALNRVFLRACLLFACLVSSYSLTPNCVRVTVEGNFNRSDVVFTGSVQSKSEAPERYSQRRLYGSEEEGRAGALEVLFKVETTWKGKLNQPVLLYVVNPKEDSTAGYDFEVDGEYVVFAHYWKLEANGDVDETETNLWTDLCSQNINLESVENQNPLVRKLAFLKSKLELLKKKSEDPETLDQDTKTSESSELTGSIKRQEAQNLGNYCFK